MERYAFPRIGRRPVSEVNTADVLEILTLIWHVKTETARAVRQRIRSVLEWAIAMDLRNDSPCDRVLPVLRPQNDIRPTPSGAAPQGRGHGHRDGAGVGLGTAGREAGVRVLVLTVARSGDVRLATPLFLSGNPRNLRSRLRTRSHRGRCNRCRAKLPPRDVARLVANRPPSRGGNLAQDHRQSLVESLTYPRGMPGSSAGYHAVRACK